MESSRRSEERGGRRFPFARRQGRQFPFAEYRQLRFEDGVRCPRCGGSGMGWGGFSGRKRYRCRSCRRTFSDFTATPLAYLKKVDRWPRHCASVRRGETLRHEAASLRIDRQTAFRWRHRLLAALDDSDAARLVGLVAVRRWPFALSHKGSRSVEVPRRRGYPLGWRALSAPSVWAIFAESDDRRIASRLVGQRWPSVAEYERALGSRIERHLLIPRMAMLAAAGRRRGRHRLPDARERMRRERSVSGYVLHMRRWLRRFRGVATRYLGNYLAWHRFLEMTKRVGDARPLRRLVLVRFP